MHVIDERQNISNDTNKPLTKSQEHHLAQRYFPYCSNSSFHALEMEDFVFAKVSRTRETVKQKQVRFIIFYSRFFPRKYSRRVKQKHCWSLKVKMMKPEHTAFNSCFYCESINYTRWDEIVGPPLKGGDPRMEMVLIYPFQ